MTLLESLQIAPGLCVAVVGAGGKTTLCWRLVQELAARNERAIFTTTTKIWKPVEGAFDFVQRSAISDQRLALSGSWRTACLAKSIEGEINNTPINGSFMPTVQTKLIGFGPDELCNLQSLISNPHSLISNPHSLILNPQSPITLLVEADGARGLRLKAPSEGEPQIPPCADVVCVLANLDAIGRPLDDRIAHRVNVIARLTQTMPGSIITAPLLATLLAHPEGGLKGIPRTARKVAVLTQHNENAIHPDATGLMQTLVQRGFFDVAVTIAPRATQAVLGKVAR